MRSPVRQLRHANRDFAHPFRSRRGGGTVTAVMPRMTPFGDVGRRGVRAYAARGGQTEEAYLKQMGELLTPEMAGSALA